MSLSSAKARPSRLRGCPPEDPRDRIRAPQEIPSSLTRNTTHSSLRSNYCGARYVYVHTKCMNIVCSSKTFRGNILFSFEVGSVFSASTLLPMVIQNDSNIYYNSQLHERVWLHGYWRCWLSVQYSVCSSILSCLSGVIQSCPCEKTIRLSLGLFLVLVHVQL